MQEKLTLVETISPSSKKNDFMRIFFISVPKQITLFACLYERLNIGDKIPEFELFNYDKTKLSDKDFLGKKTMFVFMPFPYSSVCDKEICELRDYQESFLKEDTSTILITVGASPTNRSWAAHHNIEFPILSDFWPHGEVAKKFGCFHEGAGISLRYTYITDGDNTITEIIKSDEIGVERDFSEYSESFRI